MKKVLVNYIIKNKRNFLIITIIFVLGVSLGVIFVNTSNDTQKEELNSYVTALIKNIKEAENINRIELLLLSIKQNACFILLIWFLGCTIIGGLFIYAAILYKGFAARIYYIFNNSCARNKKWSNFFLYFFAVTKYHFYTSFFYNC